MQLTESSFKPALQSSICIDGVIVYVQQFGICWGYLLINADTRAVIACDYRMTWTMPDACSQAQQSLNDYVEAQSLIS